MAFPSCILPASGGGEEGIRYFTSGITSAAKRCRPAMLASIELPRKSKISSCTPMAANERMSPAISSGVPEKLRRAAVAIRHVRVVERRLVGDGELGEVAALRFGHLLQASADAPSSPAAATARRRWRRPGASRRRAAPCGRNAAFEWPPTQIGGCGFCRETARSVCRCICRTCRRSSPAIGATAA